jgi:ribosomal protein S18 acetylase RimI-like enzyme
MTLQAILRRPHPSEQAAIQTLVQMVVDEAYGGLWAESPLQIDIEDWSRGWVAITDGKIAGVILTDEDLVSDLWVLQPYRNFGIGALLLAQGEAEIAERKYALARLRVVSSNAGAQAFYKRHGWTVCREFTHEHLPITMIAMAKTLKLSR